MDRTSSSDAQMNLPSRSIPHTISRITSSQSATLERKTFQPIRPRQPASRSTISTSRRPLTSRMSSSTQNDSIPSTAQKSPVYGAKIQKARPTAKAKPSPTMLTTCFMRVTVNNPLGTKHEIVCVPSDTIADFKKLVAHKTGMHHEAISLKRQGQRPLKSFLTLEDCEIGDGSSLDLDVDTT